MLPFDTKTASEDPGLARRLRDEHADAILAWAIEGWSLYSRDGLGPTPTACKTAAARLRADMSLVDAWLDECCEHDPEAAEPSQAVAASWQGWCVAQHVPERERLSSVALGRMLTARGFPVTWAGGRNNRRAAAALTRLRR